VWCRLSIHRASLLPSGTAKMGSYEYIMTLNNIPTVIDQLNNIPIKVIQGRSCLFSEMWRNAHDGYQPQLNIVNKDGARAVLFNILKMAMLLRWL